MRTSKRLLFILTFGLIGIPVSFVGFLCAVIVEGFFVGMFYAKDLLREYTE